MPLLSRLSHRINNPKVDISTSDKSLGFIDAFSIGIGGIVGGGIFATIGLAIVESRGATYLSFLIGGVVALLTAYSYLRLSVTYPSRGGTVKFINQAFGEGVFTGSLNVLLIMSYVVLLAVYAYAFATYAVATFLPNADYDFWHRVMTCVIMIVLALVNFVGPNIAERSEGFFNVSKLLILLAFVVMGLFAGELSFERLSPADWVSAPTIIATGMLVFISYEGFELIANVSDQVRDKEKNLKYAYFGSVITAMVFYMFIIVVVIGHLSFEAITASRDYALSAAAQVFIGKTGFILLSIGAILATASAINAGLFGASKLPRMLAKEGEAPERYERKIWGRTPVGLLVITVLVLVIANFLDLHALAAAASSGFIITFLMVNIANAKLAKETKSRRWICILGALVCFAALVILLIQIGRNPAHRYELWFIGALIVFPFLYQLVFNTYKHYYKKRY
ncbi:MAG: APC family permease [Thermodesulfobacteriota bacterium]